MANDSEKNEVKLLVQELSNKYENIKAIIKIDQFPFDEETKIDSNKHNLVVLIDDLAFVKSLKEGNPNKKLKEKVMNILEKLKEMNSQEKNMNLIPLPLSQLWDHCYDGRYALLEIFVKGEFVYDTGLAQALKLVEVHKRKVLDKFKRYIVAYVLAGSLVRGEATKSSDVDTFVVVDDTDVKRLPRSELKEKLRAIIIGMAFESSRELNLENKLNVQVYLLTDFWESLKEANPVIYTFLRDGIPLYDKGTFMPWKQLLRLGLIQPSIEAIDKLFSSGEKILEGVKYRMKNLAIEDLYYAMLTPSQSALMLYGLPPPTPKETVSLMKRIFVVKEKLLEEKYIQMLEEIVKLRKDIEHGNKKDVTGKELDRLMNNANQYLKRLKRLVEEVETKKEKEIVLEAYNKTEQYMIRLINFFNIETNQGLDKHLQELVNQGKVPSSILRNYQEIKRIYELYNQNKLSKADLEKLKKAFRIIEREIEQILDYDRIARKNSRLKIIYANNKKKAKQEVIGELYVIDSGLLFITDISNRLNAKVYKLEEKQWYDKKFNSFEELQKYIIDHVVVKALNVNDLEPLKALVGEFKIMA